GIRVPAIARWPRHIAAGSRNDHAWYFADVMPTLAEAAGCADRVPAGNDGLSMLPLFSGKGEAPDHEAMYWELWGPDLHRAARQGHWKAVWPGESNPIELYNLESDEAETHDVAGEHPDVVAALKAVMEREHTDPPPQTEPLAPDGRQYR